METTYSRYLQTNSVIHDPQYAQEGTNYGEQPSESVVPVEPAQTVQYVQTVPIGQTQNVPATVQTPQYIKIPEPVAQPVVVQQVPSVVPQLQSVVPVATAQQMMYTTNNDQQQVVYVQPQLSPAPATINGTVPINNGACSMLNDAKITALINETRKDVNKVTIPTNWPAQDSGLIDRLEDNGQLSQIFTYTEKVIFNYQCVISDVYNNYIKNNPNKGNLNERFQNFSNELMDKIFDVITKYNKLYSFYELGNRLGLLSTQEANKYNELNENGTGESKLYNEVVTAINEANGLLKSKLHEFNSSLKASKQQRANELFFPNSSNSEEQSVDDMAIDDCVFSKSNIDKLFPNASNMNSTDYDAREGFLKKLGIGEDDLSNAQFVCNINTFTDALLEAAQSTINNEYDEPSQGQYGCIRNCIKNALDAAKGGWNRVDKVFKQLNSSIDGRVKRIVIERYQAIFKNIKQFIFSYDNYLNNKLKKAENDKEGSKIRQLINKNREMLKGLKVPKEINNGVVINNNVSQIGLNYRKFQGNSLDDLFQ